MKIAWLHGLESKPDKDRNNLMNSYFDEFYAPHIDYKRDKDIIFDKTLKEIKDFNPDVIAGSSMGAWMAFHIGNNLNIPTLLFNPALSDRSLDVRYKTGNSKPLHTIVLGNQDIVVPPDETIEWLKNNKNNVKVSYENIGHRIPFVVFKKYMRIYLNMNESILPFSDWLNKNS